MAQAKEAKAEWSVFLHVQDVLAASAWLRQDDRTGETSATAVPAAASILPGCHQFAINSLQMYSACLIALQKLHAAWHEPITLPIRRLIIALS